MKTDLQVSRPRKRSDKEFNQSAIRDAFLAILKEKKGRRPTRAEIAERTGIHYNTIRKHLRGVDFRDLLTEEQATFRILTDDVILSIYRSAMKGSSASQKLWLQVVEGWQEKQEVTHSGSVAVTDRPPVIIEISKA